MVERPKENISQAVGYFSIFNRNILIFPSDLPIFPVSSIICLWLFSSFFVIRLECVTAKMDFIKKLGE
jgi:hypothetical protein